jgi:hypothetical protein
VSILWKLKSEFRLVSWNAEAMRLLTMMSRLRSILEPVVELRAPRAGLDVLQRVGRVGARAPHAAVLARLHVGDVGPDHRQLLRAEGARELVHVVELLRVGLVGGDELAHAGIGLLQVDVDQRRARAEPEALARRIFLDLLEQLARGLAGKLHFTSCPGWS